MKLKGKKGKILENKLNLKQLFPLQEESFLIGTKGFLKGKDIFHHDEVNIVSKIILLMLKTKNTFFYFPYDFWRNSKVVF